MVTALFIFIFSPDLASAQSTFDKSTPNPSEERVIQKLKNGEDLVGKNFFELFEINPAQLDPEKNHVELFRKSGVYLDFSRKDVLDGKPDARLRMDGVPWNLITGSGKRPSRPLRRLASKN